MNKFGQIVTEMWSEWMKDPDSYFYLETSKETLKEIFSELLKNDGKDQAIFHDPISNKDNVVDFNACYKQRLSASSTMKTITTEIVIFPCLGRVDDNFGIYRMEVNVTFLRNDTLPKGKVIIRKKPRNDPFL